MKREMGGSRKLGKLKRGMLGGPYWMLDGLRMGGVWFTLVGMRVVSFNWDFLGGLKWSFKN